MRTEKGIWPAVLGITALVALDAMPAPCEPLSTALLATVDSLTFASMSNRLRPDSQIRVYPIRASDGPLMLRGYHLAPWGIRERLVRVPGQSARRSEALHWNEVESVEVKRTSARLGAGIGATTLGVSYLAMAIHLSSENGGADGSAAFWIYGFNTAVSVWLGRIIGKSIGSKFQKWETVYVSHRSEE